MLAGTATAWALFPALGLWGAATLGVILAPTDAALGQAVVSNRSVPQRVRQRSTSRSGLNDGLAFPALLVVVSLAAGTHARDAGGWLGFVGAQLVLGPLAGALVGGVGGRLVERALARRWMDELYLRLAALALPLGRVRAGRDRPGQRLPCRVRVRHRGCDDDAEPAAGPPASSARRKGSCSRSAVFVLFGATLLPDLGGLVVGGTSPVRCWR